MPCPSSACDQVGEHGGLRARVHVEAERDVELAGLHAERNGRQHDDARPGVPGPAGGLGGDVIALDGVGGVGQVVVVRLGRAPGQDGDLEAGVLTAFQLVSARM